MVDNLLLYAFTDVVSPATRVTPLREVVDHDGIEQYYKDARRLFRRCDNHFSLRVKDKALTVNSEAPVPKDLTPLWLCLPGLALALIIASMSLAL